MYQNIEQRKRRPWVGRLLLVGLASLIVVPVFLDNFTDVFERKPQSVSDSQMPSESQLPATKAGEMTASCITAPSQGEQDSIVTTLTSDSIQVKYIGDFRELPSATQHYELHLNALGSDHPITFETLHSFSEFEGHKFSAAYTGGELSLPGRFSISNGVEVDTAKGYFEVTYPRALVEYLLPDTGFRWVGGINFSECPTIPIEDRYDSNREASSDWLFYPGSNFEQ